jgi:hypothetical protein
MMPPAPLRLLHDPRLQLVACAGLTGSIALALYLLFPDMREVVTRGTVVLVPALFLLAAALLALMPRALPLSAGEVASRRMRWMERAISLMVPLGVHFFDPPIWVDDAGFVLRYFAQAQEGCFYCFNASDGPVLGISSFLFGVLGNGLAWTRLLTPEQCLLVLTYAGLYLATHALQGLLRVTLRQAVALPLAVLAVLAFNKSFWAVGNGGMEAPLHLAISLFALKAFVEERHLRMWGLLALAVISKLDAVPLVLAVAGLWAFRTRKQLLPLSTRNPQWRALVLGGLVPILLYLGLVSLLFGSPFPQSAFVKVFLQVHPQDSFFPFLTYFLETPFRMGFLGVGLLLFGGYQLLLWWDRDPQWSAQTAPGWAFLGVMALYYVYNPAEKMIWYYVLPETLLLVQSFIALAGLCHRLPQRASFPALLAGTGLAALLFLTNTLNEIRWFRRYERWVEVERAAIGHALAARTQAGDTLMAGHGLLSAFSPAYVIDITGLNSRLATDYGLDYLRMLRELRPDWVALPGWGSLFPAMQALPYMADTVYYDITLHRNSAWRIWRKVPDDAARRYWEPVPAARISGDIRRDEPALAYHRILAHDVRLTWPEPPLRADALDLGVYRRATPYVLTCRQYVGDSLAGESQLQIAAAPAWMGPPYFSQALRIPLAAMAGRPFRVELAAADTATFELVDPMLRMQPD